MKNYKFIVPVALLALLVVSWYMLISGATETKNTYDYYLEEARGYAEVSITQYAIQNYLKAIEVNNNPDVYVEVAEYYKTHDSREHIDWCEDFLDAFPTDARAYNCMLEAYLLDEDYEACFDIIETARRRQVSSEYIDKINNDLKYVYGFEFGSFDDVSSYGNNYCAVLEDDRWGFVDRYGALRIGHSYVEVGAFSSANCAPVVNSKGEVYFVDKAGLRVKATKDKYLKFGMLVSDVMTAQKEDGKYTYLNGSFDMLFGNYDYASTMNYGIAAVKNADKWSLINYEGKKVGDKEYLDIVLDEKEIAFRSDRVFVSSSDGKYIMLDGKAKQVGKLVFEEAMTFLSDAPTAVKVDGKWCFVGTDGKLISDKKYDGARPFLNGLAAVCIDGKWGFVDEKENVVIEPQFDGAKDFTEKGSCFIKIEDDWKLLKIYRLNRES